MNRLIKNANNYEDLNEQIEEYIIHNWEPSRWENNSYYIILEQLNYCIDGEDNIYQEDPKNYYSNNKEELSSFRYPSINDYLESVHNCSEYIILNYDYNKEKFTIKQCGWNNDDNKDYSNEPPAVRCEICDLNSLSFILNDNSPEVILNNLFDKCKNKYSLKLEDLKY